MPNVMLCVFEGTKTEPIIFNKIKSNYFSDNNNIIVNCFEGSIHNLCQEIINDPYLDIVELLRERNQKNKKILEEYTRDDISQVYLFFDLDPQDVDQFKTEKIEKLLNVFDNETESGHIFISYPMVEAIRHFHEDNDFVSLTISLGVKKYKNLVHTYASNTYNNFKKLNKKQLDFLIKLHIAKSNHIRNCSAEKKCTNNCHSFNDESIESVSSKEIFQAQKEKYMASGILSIISSFPLFLHYYYGNKIHDRVQ